MQIVALMCVLFLGGACIAEELATIHGRVRDSNGLFVSRARVLVQRNSGPKPTTAPGQQGTSLETDNNGSYTAELAPDVYDVFLAAEGFLPQAKQVRITLAEPARLDFLLEPDPTLIRTQDPREYDMSGLYAKHLKALAEPALKSLSKPRSKDETYRFLWLRTFHNPVAVRVDIRKDGTATLTTKVSSGQGGYDPGRLTTNTVRKLTRSETQIFLMLLDESGFWYLPRFAEPASEVTVDGAFWVIEGVSNGKYHTVERHAPRGGPVKQIGLEMLIHLAKLKLLYEEVY